MAVMDIFYDICHGLFLCVDDFRMMQFTIYHRKGGKMNEREKDEKTSNSCLFNGIFDDFHNDSDHNICCFR